MFKAILGENLPRDKFRWVICGKCEGNGKVDNPAFSNGFTSDEWREMNDDMMDDGETSASLYLKGFYDVPCGDCNSSGKMLVPDMAKLTFAEKRPFARARMDAKIDAEIRRESYYERMMGA